MTLFGVHVGLQHTTPDELRTVWRRVEDLGFGWISVWDHFYGATGKPDEENLRHQFGAIADFVRRRVLTGSDEEILDHIGQYVDAGADRLNISLRAPFDIELLERFSATLKLA